ncbi:MAG: hypothetical protein ACI4F5_06385 [Acutalibacteraceae bacterium]
MINCKNCIHYDVCLLEEGEIFIGAKKNGFCGKHKDKSRYIELPCKVGDMVYCINTFSQNDPRINKCEVDAVHITSGKNLRGHKKPSYALVRNINMPSLSSRIYFEKFGITAFLTREEAERALKERADNG